MDSDIQSPSSNFYMSESAKFWLDLPPQSHMVHSNFDIEQYRKSKTST